MATRQKIQTVSNVLSPANVDLQNATFMRDYNAATSTFNDFFGPMMMVAHNAMLEAWDLYEESGKKHIIRPMKRALQQFDRFWAAVKFIFEGKHGIYIDFCIQLTKQVDDDVQKLYLAFASALANDGVNDNRRMAWLYVSDLLLHNILHTYRQFLEGVTRETGNGRVAATFSWANPGLLTDCSERTIKSAHGDLPINDNINLALEIIARKINSARLQDDAAMTVIAYQEHGQYREEWAEGIQLYKDKRAAEEAAEQAAKEAYQRKIAESKARRKKAVEETLTADHAAELLSQKFSVRRKA